MPLERALTHTTPLSKPPTRNEYVVGVNPVLVMLVLRLHKLGTPDEYP
ncbi:Uncharacterised protein [Chlamydia trachomatis]|nr:Uncharacterised protein [Chlamydia trachomatis]